MFMVKGKKYVQVKEVTMQNVFQDCSYPQQNQNKGINSSISHRQVPLSVTSMNRSDCFVLDCGKGKSILIYMPAGARKMEKFRAIQVSKFLYTS
jgi:hypothetical protein